MSTLDVSENLTLSEGILKEFQKCLVYSLGISRNPHDFFGISHSLFSKFSKELISAKYIFTFLLLRKGSVVFCCVRLSLNPSLTFYTRVHRPQFLICQINETIFIRNAIMVLLLLINIRVLKSDLLWGFRKTNIRSAGTLLLICPH